MTRQESQPDAAGALAPASRDASRRDATRADVVRQVCVLVGALVAVAGAFVGSGAFGGPSQPEVGDGALAPDATLVAPGRPAFAIWSVIYTGLLVGAVRQALPAHRSDERQRRTGWLVLVSMLLNAVWIGVVQAGLLPLSVPVIVALLVVLVVVVLRLDEDLPRAGGAVERLVVDGTAGLYLGWVCVATVANVAAVLTAGGVVQPLGIAPEVWSVVVLLVATLVGVALAVRTRGRLAVGAALAWGLVWIAVERATGEPSSPVTAWAAGLGACVVVVATLAARARGPRARQR